jgi:hypothetical protein
MAIVMIALIPQACMRSKRAHEPFIGPVPGFNVSERVLLIGHCDHRIDAGPGVSLGGSAVMRACSWPSQRQGHAPFQARI